MVAEVEQAVEGGPEGAARVRDELLAAARGARTDVRIVAEGVERFAGRDCPSVHYVAKRYDVPSPSRHWRVVIPAGPRSYYVTCNACLGTFDAHEATFRGMLEAARAPAPGGQVPHAAVTLTALALLGVAALVTRMIVRAAGLR
jgi:hypothetical protein